DAGRALTGQSVHADRQHAAAAPARRAGGADRAESRLSRATFARASFGAETSSAPRGHLARARLLDLLQGSEPAPDQRALRLLRRHQHDPLALPELGRVEQHLPRPAVDVPPTHDVAHRPEALALLRLRHAERLPDRLAHGLGVIRVYDQSFR